MATLYFRNVGTAWNSPTSWSTTSATGSSAGVIPTSTDDVILNASSASCPVTTPAGVCKTLNTTGYTNTITLTTVGINVSGNITIGVNTLWSGTGTLACYGDASTHTATITSNANIIGVPFQFYCNGSSSTFTLSGDLTVNALVSTSASTGALTITINSGNIFCKTSFYLHVANGTTCTTTGTAVIQLVGTGTLTSGSGTLQNNLIINTSGVITWSGYAGTLTYNTGTITYIAGTVTGTTNSTLAMTGATTLDLNNGGLGNYLNLKLSFASSSTITLISNAYTSLGVQNANSAICVVNGYGIYISGGTLQYYSMSGTTTFYIKGTCTMNTSAGGLQNNVVFDAGASTITLGTNSYSTGTITYTSGVINPTGTFTITGTTTLNTTGMTWGTMTINSGTITLNSLLSVTTFNIGNSNQTVTFAGSAGYNIGTLNMTSEFSTTMVLPVGITYTVNTSLNLLTNTIVNPNIIKSGTPGTKATFILSSGATQSSHYVTVTDIDSSAGQTIWVWKPTLSNTLNWNTLTNTAMQFSSTFVN